MISTIEIRSKSVDPPPDNNIQGLLGLHRWAGGWNNPDRMPIVMPPLTFKKLYMTEAIQWISYKIAYKLNTAITTKIWHRLHDDDRVHTNFVGFDPDNDNAKRDYINDWGRGQPLPAYDKPFRLGGGQFVRKGYKTRFSVITLFKETTQRLFTPPDLRRSLNVLDNVIIIEPGINGIDANSILNSFPSNSAMHEYTDIIADRAIKNGHYVYGLNGFDDTKNVAHFDQGKGKPVAFPFILNQPIEFEKRYFAEWISDDYPNPLKVYYL